MSNAADQVDQNLQLARAINLDARKNPTSPYRGKFVGIVHGTVVALADNPDELDALLQQAEPDPSQTLWIEASADYDGPHYIWML